MSAGVQCETCRVFSPAPGGRWLCVVRIPDGGPSSVLASLGIGPREDPATFCSILCLAEWAYAYAMTVAAPAGTEPRPRAGTGWPG